MDAQWPTSNSFAADADRERAIEALKQNFQAGRIKADELSDRIGLALNARTFGDLDNALENLPPLRPLGPQLLTPLSQLPYAPSPVPYARPGYPAAPPPYPTTAPRSRNGLGLAAFALGLCGFLCGVPAVFGIGVGVASLFIEADRDDKGYAIAGIAMSVGWLVFFGIIWT